MNRRFFVTTLAFLAVAGCSGEFDSSIGGKQRTLYIMNSGEADEVMKEAMERNIGLKPVRIQSGAASGYTADFVFGLDRHTIIVTAEPGTGIDTSGKAVSGFYFKVNHSGVYPITGGDRARRVMLSIVELVEGRYPSVSVGE